MTTEDDIHHFVIGVPCTMTEDDIRDIHRAWDANQASTDPITQAVANKPFKQRDPLLEERGKTHGSFIDNARISQHLKSVMMGAGYRTISPVYTEALDMIALKISRILSGQAATKDHWDDIAGYAKLAAEECERETRPKLD